MRAKEFYNNLEDKKAFTKLTSTGISDNLENVFEFAESYLEAKLNSVAYLVQTPDEQLVVLADNIADACDKLNKNGYKDYAFLRTCSIETIF